VAEPTKPTPVQEIQDLLAGRHLVVVSNREPYEHRRSRRGTMVHRPVGGLVAALDPVLQAVGGTWVAWGSGDADFDVTDREGRVQVPPRGPGTPKIRAANSRDGGAYTLRRVMLSDDEVDGFYYGYANQALWPLCHMAMQHARFRQQHWDLYQTANLRFANATLHEARDDAIVWVHDYHLALCPRYLRQRRPDLFVMTFWHIPWPAWDVFRICPQRAELLDGLLANDLIGLQHPRHVELFMECAERELGARVDREEATVEYDGRLSHVQAFPISVDFAALERIARSEACERWMARLGQRFSLAGRLLALGVDRLDYTKGIPERLRALDLLFQHAPAYRERLVFIQKSAPSRTQIRSYRDLEKRVEEEITRLNTTYGTAQWRPVIHLPEPLPLEGMAALYRMADLCVVSSLADGMNLVAKEFLACQTDHKGVLVLSELAGARDELPWAVPINPYDVEGSAAALQRALEMAPEDRLVRMKHLRAYVAEHDIHAWMAKHLRYAGHLLATRAASHWLLDHADQLRERIAGRPLALLLDFDGTLAPIAPSPELAVLPEPVRETLRDLVRRKALVGIVSGRSLDDIQRRVGLPGLVYAGNHGLEIAIDGSLWTVPEAAAARETLAEVCRRLQERLRGIPGVIVEDKGLTASVHYRQTPHPRVEEVRTAVLEEAARTPQVVVRQGKQVLELRPAVAWDKGSAARAILERAFGVEWPARAAVVYIGDDRTDEDAFLALADPAVTVKVGSPTYLTAARYVARDVDEVARFLQLLTKWGSGVWGLGSEPRGSEIRG
jgi:trehalose 6-phosphate synthase/phosphatase